ncbi:NADH dehydrogenase (ubiquinone) B18 subunit [Augochlora pura]
MGSAFVRPLLRGWDDVPDSDFKPSVDPQYGFENGRRVRIPPATLDEMRSANIPKKKRDFCAHILIDYKVCERKHFPNYRKCKTEKDAYNQCVRDDVIIRMKEMERERRIRLRQKRQQERQEGIVAA